MKQKLILLTAFIFAVAMQQAHAKIWRVNNVSNFNGTTLWGSNFGGTQLYPVFKEINQAVASTSVENGDTLYVEGSLTRYNEAYINKRLIIIGAGYLLSENPNTSNNLYPTETNRIWFESGSSGSQLIGVWLSTGVPDVVIGVNNITIKRCRIQGRISLGGGSSDIRILQNFISTSSNTNVLSWGGAGAAPSDIVFNNNVCLRAIATPGFSLLECRNNVFDPPNPGSSPSIDIIVASFQNNILKNPSATVNINNGTNLNVSYNTAASPNQFGTANNNIVVNMQSLFVDPAVNSTDGDYQLQPGSAPGSDGAERGAFGGVVVQNRYRLSGLPAVPVIYDIITTGVATPTGLPVTIKARTIQ